MSGSRRETIHLSFGPTANAVTAHLLNLEGLSATACQEDAVSVCDPIVTHQRDNANVVWVPRVLIVDESHKLHRNFVTPDSVPNTTITDQTPDNTASSWSGLVQPFEVNNYSLDDYHDFPDVVVNMSYNSNMSAPPPNWVSSWQRASSELAYSPFSQYRISEEDQSPFRHPQHPLSNSEESRQVNWDDMRDEPDSDEEERAERHKRQRKTQMKQWEQERSQYEEQISSVWNQQQHVALASSSETDTGKTAPDAAPNPAAPTEADLETLSWMDYWMPPHPSPFSQCVYGLPSTSAEVSLQAPPLHSFNYTNYSPKLLEDFWEKLREELERTDYCQGFTILTEGCGLYAGMTDWVLQELEQECRGAGRWVFHVADDHPSPPAENDENVLPQPRSTELSRAQAKVRDSIQRGLAVAALSDHANVLVPLMLPLRKSQSLFRASAELAMALETATLPYRCRTSSLATLVGWNSMGGYQEGASPGSMSLRDYLTTLQPSPRFSLLELDTVATADSRARLGQALAAGTSVERDPRMRRPTSSLGIDYPGSWLQDDQFKSSPTMVSPGILKCWSPGHVANQDRSLHRHYGLSSCLRRGVLSDSSVLGNKQQYLTCLIEGMGVRYRPETCFGLVTDQSFTRLTSAGHQYGAGSYWQYLLGTGTDIPVLSVLGNSTRMYPYLRTVAEELKTYLKSSKYKGYYQREVSTGTLPEVDDCEQALEQCLDLRDVYEPPHGSGLDRDEDEQCFDY